MTGAQPVIASTLPICEDKSLLCLSNYKQKPETTAPYVAIFAQLAGGIYTKAAHVGTDLIVKVEVGIEQKWNELDVWLCELLSFIQNFFQHEHTSKGWRSFVLVHFVLLQIELQQGDQSEVLREI